MINVPIQSEKEYRNIPKEEKNVQKAIFQKGMQMTYEQIYKKLHDKTI